MGRIYLADIKIQQYIDGLAASGEAISPVYGLVIGQLSVQKDYAIHLVRTPQEDEDTADETVESKPAKPSKSPEAILESCVCNHARQMRQMLTGGLDIIGVFVLATPDETKNSQGKFRQILYSVFKSLTKSANVPKNSTHSDRLLMQICSLTKKLTCRTFDISDPKPQYSLIILPTEKPSRSVPSFCFVVNNPCCWEAAVPFRHSWKIAIKCTASQAEWKFQKITDSFVSLSSTFSLEVTIPVLAETMSHSLLKQTMSGLQPTINSILDSRALLDGQFVDETRSFDQSKGKKTSKQSDNGTEFNVDLLMKSPSASVNPSVLDCGAKMLVRGTISCRASVHSKSTVAEAFHAIKTDMVRSLAARCELLCQDLLQTEEEQDVRIVYEMPVRAYTRFSDSSVLFCDYLFQDESLTDSVERFKEVLGLSLTESDVDQTVEHIPDSDDLVMPVRETASMSQQEDLKSKIAAKNPLFSIFAIGTSLALAGVAATASYWYSLQGEL